MTTIKDISRLANVSTAAVSKVINGDYNSVSDTTRDKILKIAKELNYKPNWLARGLAKNKTNILGLILPDVTNPFFATLAKGVEYKAAQLGYNVILCNTDDSVEKERTYMDVLSQYNVAGVIITSSPISYDNHIMELVKSNTPLVSIDRYVSPEIYSVYVDNFRGTYASAEYLIKNGHSKLVFIGGDVSLKTPNQRLNGYLQALRDNGLQEDRGMIYIGNYNPENGYKAVKELLNKRVEFTAIVCANDLIAFGAVKALKERGMQVPKDVSVVGFDDIYLSSLFEPSLTTIRQPVHDMGSHAVDVLIKLIKGETVSEKVKYFGPELIERNSVRNISGLIR
jgi:LacI family transcriptional regulator